MFCGVQRIVCQRLLVPQSYLMMLYIKYSSTDSGSLLSNGWLFIIEESTEVHVFMLLTNLKAHILGSRDCLIRIIHAIQTELFELKVIGYYEYYSE
jgi:hypothetical protein